MRSGDFFVNIFGKSITLSSKVDSMQNSYSFPNIVSGDFPACVYQEIATKIFILSGFKKNSQLRVTLMFINRKINKKIVVVEIKCSYI